MEEQYGFMDLLDQWHLKVIYIFIGDSILIIIKDMYKNTERKFDDNLG